MRARTTRWRAATASGVLVGAVLALPAAAPRAQTEPAVVTAAGFLRLHVFGSGGQVTWERDGAVVATQTISSNRCKVAVSGDQLLAITPSTGAVGLVSNGLGVRQRNNCATAEGRIAGSERLTVALGAAIAADIGVTSAELDIEGKFGASLGVTLDGVALDPIALGHGSDNGPDSGPGDNDRVVVPAPVTAGSFRTMMLSAASGEVSLEGGGDYSATPGPADTIFHLGSTYDHAVDCNESVVAFGGEDDAASEATFVRELNDGAETPDDCETIPVTLDIEPGQVVLNKTTIGLDTGALQAVNSTLEIIWAPRAAVVPLPARQIDLDGPGTMAFENVQWCAGVDGMGNAVHQPDARFDGTASNGLLPWCLVSESTVLQTDGSVVQTQLYDGYGDPYYK